MNKLLHHHNVENAMRLVTKYAQLMEQPIVAILEIFQKIVIATLLVLETWSSVPKDHLVEIRSIFISISKVNTSDQTTEDFLQTRCVSIKSIFGKTLSISAPLIIKENNTSQYTFWQRIKVIHRIDISRNYTTMKE